MNNKNKYQTSKRQLICLLTQLISHRKSHRLPHKVLKSIKIISTVCL